jgi:uncharacterized protein
MLHTGRRTLLAVVPCAALLGSCASPSPVLYALAPVSGSPEPGGPKVVVLRDISLAHYLERLQIVRSSESYRLDVEANNWWGESLNAMIGRVLAQNLSQRMPDSAVFGEAGAISVDADATVEINVLQFDANRGGNVILAAQIAVSHKKKRNTPTTRSVRISVPPQTPDLNGEVAAMSAALGQLADAAAAMLRARQ